MAIEDGASLAECIERAETTQDLPKVLHAFEAIRRPRCERVQDWSAIKGRRALLHHGSELTARDDNFKMANAWVKAEPWDGTHIDEIPELASPHWKAWLSGHNAIDFVCCKCQT